MSSTLESFVYRVCASDRFEAQADLTRSLGTFRSIHSARLKLSEYMEREGLTDNAVMASPEEIRNNNINQFYMIMIVMCNVNTGAETITEAFRFRQPDEDCRFVIKDKNHRFIIAIEWLKEAIHFVENNLFATAIGGSHQFFDRQIGECKYILTFPKFEKIVITKVDSKTGEETDVLVYNDDIDNGDIDNDDTESDYIDRDDIDSDE